MEGGYSLAHPPEQITLRDIVKPYDNPLEATLESTFP
jgi:DNA-binding IscR family transcriptional regulator